MAMLFRLAIKELSRSFRSVRLVFLVVFIGFLGPFAASVLRSSVSSYFEERSRQILSADLVVSALRPFTNDEIEKLKGAIEPKRMAFEVEFVTMARGEQDTALVEIKAVDGDYPVYGGFRLKGESEVRDASSLLAGERLAWAYPEVLEQLHAAVGGEISLGKERFKIAGVLEDAPGSARLSLGFAPRVFISRAFVNQTGLLNYGSQIFYRIHLAAREGMTPTNAAAFAKRLIEDPDVFLRTPDDSIEGLERFFKFFNLYLVVISMSVFALAWMSAYYIIQVYIQDRMRNAAILMTAGASRFFAAMVYAVEIAGVMVLALLAAAGVIALIVGAVQGLGPRAFGAFSLPEGFVLKLTWRDIAVMAGVALVSGLAFCLPVFSKVYSLSVGGLLQESALGATRRKSRGVLFGYALVLGVFFALSSWLMDSWENAGKFMGAMALACLLGWALGRGLFAAAFACLKRRPGRARLIATNLSRGRFGTNLGFLALLLVSLILNLIPHLLESMTTEIKPREGREIPALFLFNIPESKVDAVKAFVETHKAELKFLSPMILARLSKVNGAAPANDMFQRFPVRVSYREHFISSEALARGEEFAPVFDPAKQKLPELSMELRFAERNGFKIGDELEFDVQGIPVTGRIANLRRVKWTDFHPNFFMTFQGGVLDDAPKTYLANVRIPGSDDPASPAKVRLQYELIREFPDLSVIDIGRMASRILGGLKAFLVRFNRQRGSLR